MSKTLGELISEHGLPLRVSIIGNALGWVEFRYIQEGRAFGHDYRNFASGSNLDEFRYFLCPKPKKQITRYLWCDKSGRMTHNMYSEEDVNGCIREEYPIRLDWSATIFDVEDEQ